MDDNGKKEILRAASGFIKANSDALPVFGKIEIDYNRRTDNIKIQIHRFERGPGDDSTRITDVIK